MSPSKKFMAWSSSNAFHGPLRRPDGLLRTLSGRLRSLFSPFTSRNLRNLQSEYGGFDVAELWSGDAANGAAVKTETIGGCGSCGTAGSVTRNYFYMGNNGSFDPNVVERLTVEDTQDSAGNALYRKVFCLDNDARLLRRAFIQDPVGSPTYWCESWAFATSGKKYRLAEYRMPSAHTSVTTAWAFRSFLAFYGDTSWTNDSGTVNASSGAIRLHSQLQRLPDRWTTGEGRVRR
jgi:hypothetical protein